MEELERQSRLSDEGLGHSGCSDDEQKPVKTENLENIELDADGKKKEDLYKCRYCDRTFCYLCHLKVIITKISNFIFFNFWKFSSFQIFAV